MQGDIFSYALLAALATGLLVAAVTDYRRRQIDNWLNLAIALGAPLFWLASGLTLGEMGIQLAIAFATFVVVAALFALGQMGGGDVKLLTALSLWIAPSHYMLLLVVMALSGGLLTLIFGALHVMRRKSERVAIPYGIAISIAGLWVLASQYLPIVQGGGPTG